MQRHETLLVTNVNSNTVTLIDEGDIRNKVNLTVGKNPHEVVISPCGRYALVSNYGDLTGRDPGDSLTSIDILNKAILETIHLPVGSRPHGIAFISANEALVTAQGIDSLLVVRVDDDFKNGTVVNTIKLPCGGAHMVTVTKDAKYAYVGCFSGSVCKIDVSDLQASDRVIQQLSIGHHAAGLALTPEEKLLFVSDMKDNIVAVVNTDSMTIAAKIKTRLGPSRVLSYNDGKSILVIDSIAGKSEIIDVPSLVVSKSFNTTNTYSFKTGMYRGGFFGLLPVPANAVIKDDQTAYVTNLYAGNVSHVDLRSGEILETFEADVCPDGISHSSVSLRRP